MGLVLPHRIIIYIIRRNTPSMKAHAPRVRTLEGFFTLRALPGKPHFPAGSRNPRIPRVREFPAKLAIIPPFIGPWEPSA